MKKITLIAAVAVVALAFSSCKKDWTCTCNTTNATSAGSTTTNGDPVTHKKITKSQAKGNCHDMEVTGTSTYGGTSTSYTTTETCTLAKK